MTTEENKENIKEKEEVLEQEETLEKEVSSVEEEIENQTVEQLLEAKLLKIEEELRNSEDKYLRLYAEFENFKKRKNQEILTNNTYKSQKIVTDILPSIDNLERAIQATEENEANSSIIKGIQMVYEGLINALKNEGVEVINPNGEQFDPNFHQAVIQEEDKEQESGIVLETFQKGYKLKERVIRPAMVKVNS